MTDRVAVVGAGSWGTAVAGLVGATHPVSLWARSPELASSMTRSRENATYLPGIRLPDGLSATASLEEALEGAGVVFMAVPSHGFRAVLEDLQPFAAGVEAIVSLAKGIEIGTNLRMSEVVAQVLPDTPAGVLTGPNLAERWPKGNPPPASWHCRTRHWRVTCRVFSTPAPFGSTWAPTSWVVKSRGRRRM